MFHPSHSAAFGYKWAVSASLSFCPVLCTLLRTRPRDSNPCEVRRKAVFRDMAIRRNARSAERRRHQFASRITLPLAVIRLGGTSGFRQVHRLQNRCMPRSVTETSGRFRLTYSFQGKRSTWVNENESYSETAKVIISWQTKGQFKRRSPYLGQKH
jgi:hypothetical protein